MDNRRPEINDEEIGMRTFQLRKARAVERAMERLRGGMKADWALLSHAEIEALSWVFGEVWAYVARAEWEELHFSKLKYPDVRTLLGYAKEIAKHTRDSVTVLTDAFHLIESKG
jgi:hypothetical protein